ncbi:MAG: hypothetical protein EOO01_26940, partial [Chitinophagaceae bacterium]
MKWLFLLTILAQSFYVHAQSDTVVVGANVITLSEVIVGRQLDVPAFIQRVKDDTSFYKAFRNLRILGFTAINDIRMLNRRDELRASLKSTTRQLRADNCRTMKLLSEEVTGDMYNKAGKFNYYTAQMYASLFFTQGKVCNETNIVGDRSFSLRNKSGMDKRKEQLKMLFFDPGSRIGGLPFMSNKTEIYSDRMADDYDMRISYEEFNGVQCYVFHQQAKQGKRGKVVIDEMTTWFDDRTFDIVGRNYSLSYDAGVYDFNVQMEVKMQSFNGLTVPMLIRYMGNWKVIGKKR